MNNQKIYIKTKDMIKLNKEELTELLLEDDYNNKGVLRLLIQDLVRDLKQANERVEMYKQDNLTLQDKLVEAEGLSESDL